MIRAGVDPDVLGEITWWRTDDLWLWALDALVVYVGIAASAPANRFESCANASPQVTTWR